MAQTYRAALRALMERYEQADIWDRTYIRKQMAAALRLWRVGKRPDGNHSDLVCTFWCELPSVKPRYQIQYTRTYSWNGRLEKPVTWLNRELHASESAASARAHYVSESDRFGLSSRVLPVYRGTWSVYLTAVSKFDDSWAAHATA